MRQTSSSHGPDGYISTDHHIIGQMISRMERKLLTAVDDFTFFELDLESGADTLLIVYGVTARAAKTAVATIRDGGKAISLLILKTLYPVPEVFLMDCISRVKQVVVVEMNLGQYVREIERLVSSQSVIHYGRMDGELVSPEKIREVIGL